MSPHDKLPAEILSLLAQIEAEREGEDEDKAGDAAAREGLPDSANPYASSDPRHWAWAYGWVGYHSKFAVANGQWARAAGIPRDACPYVFERDGDICSAWFYGWDGDD